MIRELIAATDDAVSVPVPVPRVFYAGAVVSIGASHLNGSEKVIVWERFTEDGEWRRAKQWGAASETNIEVTEASGSVDITNPARRLGVTKTATMYPCAVYAVSQDGIGQ